nr:helix-hairpin-helix domain-containing protein [Sedimentibacter sp.]
MNNGIYKKGLAVVLTVTIIIFTVIGVKLSGKEKEIDDTFKDDNLKSEEIILNDELASENSNGDNASVIMVDVDGAVKNPGVYELIEGDRVEDALKKAGGLLETSDTKNINRARILADGEKIYIAEKGEINSSIEMMGDSIYNTNEAGVSNGKININIASKELLMSLDGIGEVYSQRIIDYRNKMKFSNIEDIKKVKGIGEKTFEGLKDKITVN